MKKIDKKTTENCCETENCCVEKKHCKYGCHKGGNSCALYGLGIFGALFYFLQNATTFSLVMVGIFKSVFWPAFLVFRIFTDLKM